jgi:hypothetical protein
MLAFTAVPIRWLSRLALLAACWDWCLGTGLTSVAASYLVAQALWSLHVRVART